MNNGWVKIYRQLLDKPIWNQSSAEQKVILITLLLMANNKESEWEWQGKPYRTKPGQFITSIKSICEACGKGITVQNVRTALKRFEEKYHFLTNESTKVNRLITIVNWGLYQGSSVKANNDTNSQLTDNQQSPNSQLTTNKNLRTEELKNYDDEDATGSVPAVNEPSVGSNSKPENSLTTWESLWNFPNVVQRESLFELIDTYGDELTDAAIKRAGQNGVSKSGALGYVTSILENWKTKNVTTIEQAREETRHFMAEKQQQNYSRRSNKNAASKQEVEPKWAKPDYVAPTESKAFVDDQQAKINELLARIQEGREEPVK